MKGSRWARRAGLVVTTALLGAAAAQAGDLPTPPAGGNTAGGSVGVVQVGPVTVDPTPVVAETPVAGATGSVTATVGSTGGNAASKSGGVVQAGGGNAVSGSLGAVQVS